MDWQSYLRTSNLVRQMKINGETLRNLRDKAGLGLTEASRQIGITKAQLWRYEVGRQIPSIEMAEKIFETYGYEIELRRLH